MKVNMTPNPLDVVTIHASQGDTEARQWEFELHNNGELIDTSGITEQLFFKSYKGGTEQILPENGSTPTTSPFLGDIRYPQGFLTDQEFTYRESPTEEDGLANIVGIKGQTLKWNQLVQNGNFATADGWTSSSSTNMTIVGASNNRLLFTTSSAIAAIMNTQLSFPKNHKLLFKLSTDLSNLLKIRLYTRDWVTLLSPTELTKSGDFQYLVINPLTDDAGTLYIIPSVNDNVQHYISNVQVFDLTTLGIDNLTDNEIVKWFATYYPLPYYAYNAGTLLSFNGNGIKTVGKNLFDFSQFANGTITFENGDLKGTAGQFSASYSNVVSNGIELKYPENTQITISFDARTEQNDTPSGNGIYLMASENGTSTRLARATNETSSIQHITATIPSNRHIDKLGWTYGASALNIWHITNFQVEFGTETTYEPYTSSTLSLPISTYFPNGMKSAGSVYDELTETKAITRVGSVDLGSLTWEYQSEYTRFRASLTGFKPSGSQYVSGNILCAKYTTGSMQQTQTVNNIIAIGTSGINFVYVKDTSYTDATAFKTAMNGVYLYYELATPTETSLTTASLVTENAEIPLSNEDGVLIGKCTEQLSAEPGFHDAKIKLADGDGTCYSNKIQLHVERSPQ